MNTPPNNWGYPGENATDIQKINYSNHLKKLNKEEIKYIDLILIDGRFRVACCLNCYDVIKDDCIIAFDDFLDRMDQYGIVLDYFDIVDKTVDNRMAILKKKKNMSVPQELVYNYQLISK